MLQPKDRLAEWIKKQDPYICCSDLKTLKIQTESERMEKYFPCKWEAKESWSSNPYIRQIDLILQKITRDKEEHYVMIKGSIQEEDVTIVNIYDPNIGAPQYIR